jgi:spore coat polysaccharide biosynthesis protein SpsF
MCCGLFRHTELFNEIGVDLIKAPNTKGKTAMKVEALIQARMSSARLPGKVLMPLGGMPSIFQVVKRVRAASSVDRVTVLTSTDSSDDELVDVLNRLGVDCFRGSLHDVLNRFTTYINGSDSSLFLRITGDCPLIDPVVIDEVVAHHQAGNFDYTSNTLMRTFPKGLDVEVFNPGVLRRLIEDFPGLTDTEREHVTIGVYGRPEVFRLGSFTGVRDLSKHRWTLDTRFDYDFLSEVFDLLAADSKTDVNSVIRVLKDRPDLQSFET